MSIIIIHFAKYGFVEFKIVIDSYHNDISNYLRRYYSLTITGKYLIIIRDVARFRSKKWETSGTILIKMLTINFMKPNLETILQYSKKNKKTL